MKNELVGITVAWFKSSSDGIFLPDYDSASSEVYESEQEWYDDCICGSIQPNDPRTLSILVLMDKNRDANIIAVFGYCNFHVMMHTMLVVVAEVAERLGCKPTCCADSELKRLER